MVDAADSPPTDLANCSHRSRLRERLCQLYHGRSPSAVRFRLAVIALDLVLIAFFIAAPFFRSAPAFLIIDYAIAAVVVADLAARALASRNLWLWFRRHGLVDMVVLTTLLFPLSLANFAFLRILRLWSLLHSDFFWETVARRYDDTRWEDMVKAIATLVTFLFMASGLVYALYAQRHVHINSFLDAVYFTVTAVTTTGFGDVTLPGPMGKMLSIVIMVSGVTLFVRLGHAIFRPNKVRFPCPSCGLLKHEPDAVHCKACGALVNIPNDDPAF